MEQLAIQAGILLTRNYQCSFLLYCFSFCTVGSSSKVRGPAPTAVPASTSTIAPAAYSQAQTGQQSRLQGDPSVEPPPVHYVNYLAYQGYSVEIFGGKHFKTPEGEFVEMKSGTQYKILVKNSRAYGKDA